jgi:hypothetical protein
MGKGQLTGNGYGAKAGGNNYVNQREDKDMHPIGIVRRQGQETGEQQQEPEDSALAPSSAGCLV